MMERAKRKCRVDNVVQIKDKRKRRNVDDRGDDSEVGSFYIPKDIVFTQTLRFTSSTKANIGQLLKEKLTDAQLSIFKKTCFGHFLELPQMYVQPQLFRHLMLREIVPDKPDTFTVVINGARLEFGMREFSVISGLTCHGDETCDYDPKLPNRLIRQYFHNLEKVPKTALVDCFDGARWLDDTDAIKIAILYVLYTFVLSGDDDKKCFVKRRHFELVESGAFERYPWGKDSFTKLYLSVSKRLKGSTGFYRFCGLPLAMQVWFYECCSQVNPKIAIRAGSSPARILNWKVMPEKLYFKELGGGMFRSVGNEVVFRNFSPTDAELARALEDPTGKFVPSSRSHGTQLSSDDSLPFPAFSVQQQPSSSLEKLCCAIPACSVQQQPSSSPEKPACEVDYGHEIKKLKADLAVAGASVRAKDLQARNVDRDGSEIPIFKTRAPGEIEAPSFCLGLTQELQHGTLKQDIQATGIDKKLTELSMAGLSKGVTLNDLYFPDLNGSHLRGSDAQIEQYIDMGSAKMNVTEKQTVNDVAEEMSSSDDSEEEDKSDNDAPPAIHVSQLVVCESDKEGETPQQRMRLRQPGKYGKSPFVPNLSSAETSLAPPRIFAIKHPFMTPIDVEVDENLQESFVDWVKQGFTRDTRRRSKYSPATSKIVPPFEFGVRIVSKKEYFYLLLHGGETMSDEYIDVIFYYLRKKAKYGPHIPVKYTTTDCLFKIRIEEMYQSYVDTGYDNSVVSVDDPVAQYILGLKLLANIPWKEVDYVFLPINVRRKHWVLGVLNIKERCIRVYDSMCGRVTPTAAVRNLVRQFAVILPFYFLRTGFYGERVDLSPTMNPAYGDKAATDPFDIVFMKNLPQQRHGSLDCAVFIAAYAEYFSCGYDVPTGNFDVDIYRKRLGTVLWDYARRKQDEGASSATEDTGKEFSKKGGSSIDPVTVVEID